MRSDRWNEWSLNNHLLKFVAIFLFFTINIDDITLFCDTISSLLFNNKNVFYKLFCLLNIAKFQKKLHDSYRYRAFLDLHITVSEKKSENDKWREKDRTGFSERMDKRERRRGPSQQGVTFLSNQIRAIDDIGWSNEIFRAVARSTVSR